MLQHHIAQFHLRLFAPDRRERGLLWRHDKRAEATRRTSIKAAAALRDYYSFPGADGALDHRFEQGFSEIESQAAPILKRLTTAPYGLYALAPHERLRLASYLALLHVRAPAWWEPAHALATFTANTEFSMWLKRDEYLETMRAARPSATDEELSATRDDLLTKLREGPVVEAAREWTLRRSLEAAMGTVAPVLAGRRWTVLRRTGFPYLVLGDQPVTFHPPPDHGEVLGLGPLTPGVEIYCPLSPDSLMVIEDDPYDTAVQISPVVIPRGSFEPDPFLYPNRKAWTAARQFVMARSHADLEYVRLSLPPERRTTRPLIGVSGIPPEWEGLLSEEVVRTE